VLRPVLLGARFGSYEPFVSLIFPIFFSGRGKPRITETADTVSADTRSTCMYTHVRPSGESLTNYVALLWVEAGQP